MAELRKTTLTTQIRETSFTVDRNNRVIARGPDGGSIESQKVEALLLLAVLEELRAWRANRPV